MIFSRLKNHVLAILGAISAILWIMWHVTLGQKKKAQSEAERALNSLKAAQKRQEVSKNAQKASQDAKVKGDESIKKAVDNARSGRRDHFMRDKD